MKTRPSDFDEAVDIELGRVNRAMDEVHKTTLSNPKKYQEFGPKRAYPALLARAVALLTDSEDEEELAHNLVHLAACAKSYFQYFVESVSIEEEYDGQNSPGSEESN